jgi:hypothetical protein
MNLESIALNIYMQSREIGSSPEAFDFSAVPQATIFIRLHLTDWSEPYEEVRLSLMR